MKSLLLLFGLLTLTILTGCRQADPRADLVILNGAEPESLDPAIITGQPDIRVVRCLFEGLVKINPQSGRPIPGLATHWEISPDGLLYTFHIRSNAVWSTGEPIMAPDVLYSWRRTLDPATPSDYAAQLYCIKNGEAFARNEIQNPERVGIRALDDHTFQVELENPTLFFIDLCALPAAMVVPRHAIERHGDQWLLALPVPCNGPYQLEDWRIHNKVRVRKNPLYWEAHNVHLKVVDFLPIESPTTALNLYDTGQADIIWDKNLIPSELMDILRERPDCHTFDYLGTFFYRYNTTRAPFNDPRVRRALAMAIDKQRIVEKITRGGEKVATHFTPPGTANYQPPQGLDYNPDQARRLLADAGFPDGKGFPAFEYLFKTGKIDEQIGVELQAMWATVLGIRMELRQTEWKVYLTAQNELDYDLSRSSWIGDYNDPNTFLDLFLSNGGNNRTGWKNQAYDELIQKGNRQTDIQQRAALLQEAETILVREELPLVPIYFYAGVNFFDDQKFSGIHFNILDEHPVQAIRRKEPVKLLSEP